MKGLMTNLAVAGIGIGVISVILAIITKFTGGALWTFGALTYLQFAQTCFLGSIGVGVVATLQPKSADA